MKGVYQRWCSSNLHIGWDLCDRQCLVLVCRGRYSLGGGGVFYYCRTYYKAVRVGGGGGGSSLHSGIEFGRSRTGKGSSGGRKRGVV
jgi:hypothetical protein